MRFKFILYEFLYFLLLLLLLVVVNFVFILASCGLLVWSLLLLYLFVIVLAQHDETFSERNIVLRVEVYKCSLSQLTGLCIVDRLL